MYKKTWQMHTLYKLKDHSDQKYTKSLKFFYNACVRFWEPYQNNFVLGKGTKVKSTLF